MRIIGIDPGSEVSGVAVLDGGAVSHASNTPNTSILSLLAELSENPDVSIVIESLAAYAGRIAPQTITTAMWIGELSYRIRTEIFIEPIFVPRNSVKKWIFDTCPEVCLPRIEKKMAALHARKIKKGERGLLKKDGEMRLPSFHFVDDRIIIAALKELLKIPTPKPGKSNIFGLKEHSWQACACALYTQRNLLDGTTPRVEDKIDRKVPLPS